MDLEESTGAHGGGDIVLLDDLFGGSCQISIWGPLVPLTPQCPSIAAKRSMATGEVVKVKDVLDIQGI